MAGNSDPALEVRIFLTCKDSTFDLPERPGPIVVQRSKFQSVQTEILGWVWPAEQARELYQLGKCDTILLEKIYFKPPGLKRNLLSELVNSLLERKKRIPFDFFVEGQLLRSSLGDHLDEHGISSEVPLAVEYEPAQLPPSFQSTLEHDDWVSDVDVLSQSSAEALSSSTQVSSGQERIASACYDGILRVWDMSGNVLAATQPSEGEGNKFLFHTRFLSSDTIITAGWERPIRIWQYSEDTSAPPSPGSASLTPILDLEGRGHGDFRTLAVDGQSKRVLSGCGHPGTVALWTTDLERAPVASSRHDPTGKPNKRPRLTTPSRGPLSQMQGHTDGVAGVIFKQGDSTVAYSASLDETIRTWDLETSTCVKTRRPSLYSPLTCLCSLSPNLLVAGTEHGDKGILLVDTREDAQRSLVLVFNGHRNKISSLSPDPDNSNRFVSGSYDGCCRIWDMRSSSRKTIALSSGLGVGVSKSTARIPRATNERCDRVRGADGVKVFGVCWNREVGIVSGSEDKFVQVNKSLAVDI